jgi:hypothetical protein
MDQGRRQSGAGLIGLGRQPPAATVRAGVRRRAVGVAAPAFLALLFWDCSAIVNPPAHPLVELDERFFGCFCADPDERDRNFICVVPKEDSRQMVRGTGRGLLRDLGSEDDWDFDGGNERGGPEMARIVYIEVWGDALDGERYEVVFDPDDDSLAVRERYGTWQFEAALTRCRD